MNTGTGYGNGSIWEPYGGTGGYGFNVVDDYRLMREYVTNAIVATCVEKNAKKVASVDYGLYTLAKESPASKRLKTIKGKRFKHVQKKLRKRNKSLSADAAIVEVPEHELLDMLDKVDWRLTQGYLEIIGRAYWLKLRDNLGGLVGFRVLPAYACYPTLKDAATGKATQYEVKENNAVRTVDASELVEFRLSSMVDPDTGGLSPLQYAFAQTEISRKFTLYQNQTLDNRARPDAIFVPKGEVTTPNDAKRIEELFNQKFKGEGNGSILVSKDPGQVVPLNYAPTDLAPLSINSETQRITCNAFDLPEAMFGKDATYSNYDKALNDWCSNGITFRLCNIEAELNEQLAEELGEGVWFCFDDPTPDNELQELEEQKVDIERAKVALTTTDVYTVNEVRAFLGKEPLPFGGEAFFRPADAFGTSAPADALAAVQDDAAATVDTTAPVEPIGEQAPAVASNDLRASVGGSAAILALQMSYYARQIPRDAAINNAVLVFGFTQAEAEQLFPSLPPDAPEAEQQAATVEAVNQQVADGSLSRAIAINIVAKFMRLDQREAAKLVAHPPAKKADVCGCGTAGCVEIKAKPKGGVSIPDGKKLSAILRKSYAVQRAEYLKQIGDQKSLEFGTVNKSADGLPKKFVPVEKWTKDIAHESKPVVELFAQTGAKYIKSRVGASPDVFSVVPAKIEEGADKATLKLAQSTIATTNKDINDALDQLRQEMKDGLIEGDSVPLLRKRVEEVFENAEGDRAELIAKTEASRAVHEGMRIAAKASGVVKGFKFLVSSDACPECLELEDKEIGLDDTFVESDYDDSVLPVHPFCSCTMTEILNDEEDDSVGGDDGE